MFTFSKKITCKHAKIPIINHTFKRAGYFIIRMTIATATENTIPSITESKREEKISHENQVAPLPVSSLFSLTADSSSSEIKLPDDVTIPGNSINISAQPITAVYVKNLILNPEASSENQWSYSGFTISGVAQGIGKAKRGDGVTIVAERKKKTILAWTKYFKRRLASESIIGHIKADYRMGRYFLDFGKMGDIISAIFKQN